MDQTGKKLTWRPKEQNACVIEQTKSGLDFYRLVRAFVHPLVHSPDSSNLGAESLDLREIPTV